jgi:hypothetical protein
MIVSCSRITSGDQALQLPIMLSSHTRERLQGDLIPQANVLASVGRWHCHSVCMTLRICPRITELLFHQDLCHVDP